MLKNIKSKKYEENEPLTKIFWITQAVTSMKRKAQTNFAISTFVGFLLSCVLYIVSLPRLECYIEAKRWHDATNLIN
jgi:hypothetical protein